MRHPNEVRLQSPAGSNFLHLLILPLLYQGHHRIGGIWTLPVANGSNNLGMAEQRKARSYVMAVQEASR